MRTLIEEYGMQILAFFGCFAILGIMAGLCLTPNSTMHDILLDFVKSIYG